MDPAIIVDPDGGELGVDRRIAMLFALPTRKGDRLGQLVQSWLVSRAKSDASRQTYGIDIREFFLYCAEEDFDPLTMRIPQMDMYPAWLARRTSRRTGHPYSHDYVRRKINTVSSFFEYLVQVDARDRSPVTRDTRLRESGKRKRVALPVPAAAAVLRDGGEADPVLGPECARLALELEFTVGLRVSSICGITLDDLLRIEQDGTTIQAVRLVTKGNRHEVRAIPVEVDAALTAYLAHRATLPGADTQRALLLTLKGEPVNRFRLYRSARRAGARHGVNVTPHVGRHTYERTAGGADVPLRQRQKDLGHASPETTVRYGQVDDDVRHDGAHVVAAVLHAAMAPAADYAPAATQPDTNTNTDTNTGD